MTIKVDYSSVTADDTFKKSNFSKSLIFQEEKTVCPECGSKLEEDYERAELVCSRCGVVVEEGMMDRGPEWRAFDREQRDKRTRTGAPMSHAIHDKGLSTFIDWKNKDIYGRPLSQNTQAQFYRLRKWQKKIRVSGAVERNLAFALSLLDRISSNLGIPRSVREDASLIYKNAVRGNLIRGRSIEWVVAASIYVACRRCNKPRTLDEISEVTDVSKKEIGRTYRFLARKLEIKLKPTSPADYVPRFASKVGVSSEVESRAIGIINLAKENELISGKGPTGVAAAALYIASILSCQRRSQRDIAEASGVTEVTIRNRYKEISEKLDLTAL